MTSTTLKNWILAQQKKLDQCIADASTEYYNTHYRLPYFTFDVNECIHEMGALGRGDDLCYDRPSIGFSYSLWYHGKRVNGMLDFFIKLLIEEKDKEFIEIFDLGAGTGAIQWAVGLVYAAMKEHNLPTPNIKFVNIDSSPFMLNYNKDYLWKEFVSNFPACKSIDIDYRLISWVNPNEREYNNVWLCASYLFDHSENQKLIAEAFEEIAAKYAPQKIILLGNWQKKHLMDGVSTEIAKKGYKVRRDKFSWDVFQGAMPFTKKSRDELNKLGMNFSGFVTWKNQTWYGKVLEPIQSGLGLNFPNKYSLYQKAEKDRTKIQLTSEQKKAADIGKNPVIIIGPAGCGKSVVLTEKIKNIVESEGKEYDTSLNILLTTFNKDLVKYLGDWLEEILEDKSKFNRCFDTWNGVAKPHSYFYFKGSNKPNITVMHFDILPTKVGNILPRMPQPQYQNHHKYHLSVMKRAKIFVVKEKGIDKVKHKRILDSDFLLEEYHRVKYGMQCHTNKAYATVDRPGRGKVPRLEKNKKRRAYISAIFRKYKSLLSQENCESYIIRRERFLNKLNKDEGGANSFTHLLVDELQDCCNADYDIFYALLKNPNRLTVAGDLAQSINIGTTAKIPRSENEEMKRFDKIYLKGSFRLPFRIGECIKPLSESIKEKFSKTQNTEVYEIIPYKGAPPGARPIFVHDKDPDQLANKIKDIFQAFKVYDDDLKQIDIMQKREIFLQTLIDLGLKVEGHTVQKIKGMEKPFVVWDTLASIDNDKETEEFIYTILTRTTNILIIAVSAKLMTAYFRIIKSFKEERLIFWDNKSRNAYYNICSKNQEEIESNDDFEDEEIDDEDKIEIEI